MLTVSSYNSSIKKKITVVVIWLVALALSFLLLHIIQYKGTSFLTKILPIIIVLFMISGILLRCKFARAFTLITLYIIALFPLMANLLTNESFILFSIDESAIFTTIEIFLSNLFWAFLFIIPLYFFSNSKSMDIFFIESDPKEHLFFAGVAILMIVIYIIYAELTFFI